MYKYRFPIGQLVATPAAIKAIEEAGEDLFRLVARHSTGDWGEVCPEDAEANRLAVANGHRVLSCYRLLVGERAVKVWILTEADRSATTILLPEEY